MIYLACPYSHRNRAVRLRRFDAANKATAAMFKQGLKVFSPISHCHPVAECGGLALGWEFWAEYDREMLSVCESICVQTIDGWRVSNGVNCELMLAQELGLTMLQTKDGFKINRLSYPC